MNKKLSISKLDKLLKAKQSESVIPINYEIAGDETIELPVKRYIDLSDTLGFVNGVVNSVFPVSDDGTTTYVPEILDYSKAMHYIEYFCPSLKLDLGASRVYSMLFGSQIMRDIYKQISPAQYNSLEDAIDSAIAHKLAMIQSGERAQIADATDKIEQAAQALETLTKQFEGIGDDKMQAAFNNLASMETEDLAKAVVNIRDIQ